MWDNAVRKDIADEKVLARTDDQHAVTIDDGALWIEGCDCMVPIDNADIAREMVELLTRWINAEARP